MEFIGLFFVCCCFLLFVVYQFGHYYDFILQSSREIVAFTTIRVMCVANANIHAALFAWAFAACLMVVKVIVDVYGMQIYTQLCVPGYLLSLYYCFL